MNEMKLINKITLFFMSINANYIFIVLKSISYLSNMSSAHVESPLSTADINDVRGKINYFILGCY